ncbi:MAG TPA: GNAT family N-acetyltransferase [Kofleriaceae bacterium]|nr:GNAT family N-acetyltransferase [Kofleriaceae bacterium]
MFVDSHLAARIDRVEARISRAIAAAIPGSSVIDVDGGVAVFTRPGSPINKIVGAGFDGPLDEAELARAEAVWPEPVRIELATLASPEAAAQLSARGYRLLGFENMLVRPLVEEAAPAHEVRTDDDAAWMRILVDGFVEGDGTGALVDTFAREALEQVMRDFMNAKGFARYVAYLDGQPVGAATLRVDDGIAILAGAATLPLARRRGIQSALLAARLRDARVAGCTLAVIVTAPGSLSQKNAMKSGFQLAYSRAILQRPERV